MFLPRDKVSVLGVSYDFLWRRDSEMFTVLKDVAKIQVKD